MSTYAELKADIASWINRKDLTDTIPQFIKQAEQKMYRGFVASTGSSIALRCRDNLKKASLTPVDGAIALPNDFRELKEVTINGEGKTPISSQFYNRLKNYTGKTQVFSLRDKDWYQYPLNDTSDTFDIIYYADYSGTLVNDADTNPILTALPEIYLWGGLAMAELYIKNDARLTWSREFESSIRSANTDARRAEFSGASMAQRTQYTEVRR
jgi:hypothetical protein|tara:strand:+ start:1589 stop:2224 length:636 start_codon:yes stop_codon:yes gene_type:complete